jgi:predicted dehydrogenase
MKRTPFSRRAFLGGTAGAAFAFTFVPKSAFGANERLGVGSIGIGGKGASDVSGAAGAGAQIVALCDVDENRRAKKGSDATHLHPDAKFYRDFRVMLEKEDKRIDAVTVSTPDHVHCHASVMAMRMGKHVYCQKPMSHSIWEARLMAETAAEKKVATQMGNQAHADEPIRRAVEWVRAGLIGKVSEVHAWTNRPIWPQGSAALLGNARIQWALSGEGDPPPATPPASIDWDLWLGPAPWRAYDPCYAPFKWRGWWDFGCGALGDMGCHIMDMPYWALDLKSPASVVAESAGGNDQSGPDWAVITYRFPAGDYSSELQYVWYDGGRMPADDVIEGAGMSAAEMAKKFDLVMIGTKGKLFFKRSSTDWITSPASLLEDFDPPAPTIPRVQDEDAEWIDACRGGPQALSNFTLAGPFTEMVLLGNLAVRLDRPIEWDSQNMKAVGCPEADPLIHRAYRQGWEL